MKIERRPTVYSSKIVPQYSSNESPIVFFCTDRKPTTLWIAKGPTTYLSAVRPSVCPSVEICCPHDNSSRFRARITKCGYRCNFSPSRTLSKMALIDLDLQGHLGSKLSKSTENGLVHTITHHVLDHQIGTKCVSWFPPEPY